MANKITTPMASPPGILQQGYTIHPTVQPMLASKLVLDDQAHLKKGLTFSGVAHLALIAMVIGYTLLVPKPVMPGTAPDMTFTLVKNSSKTLPPKPDVKGDKPQLAGGKTKKIFTEASLPVKTVVPKESLPKQVLPKPNSVTLPDKREKPVSLNKPTVPTKKQAVIPVDLTPKTVPSNNIPDKNLSDLPEITPATPTDQASSVGSAPAEQLAVTPDKMAPYFVDLKKALSARWQPPRGENSLRVVTQFIIQADGRITDIEIKESSGDAETDEAARRTLEASSPLASLPPDWGVSSVPILFSFDYTVFGKSRSKKQP